MIDRNQTKQAVATKSTVDTRSPRAPKASLDAKPTLTVARARPLRAALGKRNGLTERPAKGVQARKVLRATSAERAARAQRPSKE